MSYNGSGVWTANSTGLPVVTGTTISSTMFNAFTGDVATGLSTALLKDGTQTVTANIPMSAFKLTGLGAGTANGDAIRFQQTLAGLATTKGDILVATAANAVARLAAGANGTILAADSAQSGGLVYVAQGNTAVQLNTLYAIPQKHIGGLTYSNSAGDATNDIDIAAGEAVDSTNAKLMKLASTLTKQLDAAWAVGTNAGGLDTGSIGNSDYYIWLIMRSDTGVVDALYSLSSTAPTMPTSYDYKRLIGWFKRVSAAIVAFHVYESEGGGIEMNWDAPTLDINLTNTLTTSRRTDAVKVPLNFSTTAHLNVVIQDASANANIWICCPDQTDAAPSLGSAPLANFFNISTVGTSAEPFRVRTSATGTIAARSSLATVDLYAASTMGFTWGRRN